MFDLHFFMIFLFFTEVMDEDSFDDELQPQAFVVNEKDIDDLSLDIPPTTGNEYLRRVRLELGLYIQ